jgi:hypothetical protein
MRKTPHILLLTLMGLLSQTDVLADSYELGQGWHVGNYLVAGYTNVEMVKRFGRPANLSVDDLSMYVGGRLSQWVNPFTELELSGVTVYQQGGGNSSGDFIVERFYNDVMLGEHDIFRVGNILAPVGDWNMGHAAPLMPTVTRPYTSTVGFGAYSSGVAWKHESENGTSPDINLYWQPNNEWFHRPASQTVRSFHNLSGGHINHSFSLKERVGASFQQGHVIESGETFALVGLNVTKSLGKFIVMSEAISSRFSGKVRTGASPRLHDDETGLFVLADYPLNSEWHGIVEEEYYQDHTVLKSSRSSVLAVNYKPLYVPVVWKLEYIHQAGVSASIAPIHTGLKGSFSFFF